MQVDRPPQPPRAWEGLFRALLTDGAITKVCTPFSPSPMVC